MYMFIVWRAGQWKVRSTEWKNSWTSLVNHPAKVSEKGWLRLPKKGIFSSGPRVETTTLFHRVFTAYSDSLTIPFTLFWVWKICPQFSSISLELKNVENLIQIGSCDCKNTLETPLKQERREAAIGFWESCRRWSTLASHFIVLIFRVAPSFGLDREKQFLWGLQGLGIRK